ncbi:hypothetical protein FQA39_LY01768 [Lamprigera yunnana]|nr:hypothetical protein FQA39_LY01768 [Lamprigera yunnana]
MNDNLTQQSEEIEALHAIYGSEWCKEPDIDKSYYIQITPDIQLSVTLNLDYPSSKPPSYQLLAPTLTKEQKSHLSKEFDEIYKINFGGPVLFQWIEKVKEVANANVNIIENVEAIIIDESVPKKNYNFNIIHGPIIKDRKSVFQGHVCQIEDQHLVKDVMDLLLENKKIAQATHNILAYRFLLPNGSILQDCDDDGESHAGSRLLHLLQIVDVTNVLVVVSRWYGGIQLGPDRFRHINNAARQVLEQGGLLTKKS